MTDRNRPIVIYLWLLICTIIGLTGFLIGHAIYSGSPAACHLSQPVYTGTRITGTWTATLNPGQSARLPDGDTASCTAGAILSIH